MWKQNERSTWISKIQVNLCTAKSLKILSDQCNIFFADSVFVLQHCKTKYFLAAWNSFNELKSLYYFRLHPGEVCAGGEAGKDSCDGDGGAPLVCKSQEGNWHVVGLVAWGNGCAKAGVPGIYVNVHHYMDFITAVPVSHIRNV